MSIINLGGHSGCGIFLIESDERTNFVRKVSRDEEYNHRLRRQYEKQAEFSSGGIIKAPKVLQSGINDEGLFFFDMEYVQGITLAEYIRNMEIGKIRRLVKALIEYIGTATSNGEAGNPNECFANKISALSNVLSGKNDTLDEALELLSAHDWSPFYHSFCHGDMTLENIIIKNDELYLIDFLDSFYDSYLLDLGTLLQDVQAMWSYRMDEKADMNLVLRLIVFRDLLIDAIREKDNVLVREVYYALLQKLVRVVPYAKDERTYRFLMAKINLVIREVV